MKNIFSKICKIMTIVLLLISSQFGLVSAEELGNNVRYDTETVVNNNEEIEIEYWTWGNADPAVELAEDYQELHPNISIKIVTHPWEDYWTKLPLALQGNDGPVLFNIHNSHHELIIPYLAAYEIDQNELIEDFTGVEAHIINDEIHYIDSVINTGNIYYNKTMWEEAGLTEDDIPVTWDEFREVAKKLTKFDGDKLVQSGFNWNGETFEAIISGLNYQKGELLFDESGTVVNFDNETTRENIQFLIDLYDVDNVGSKDFGGDSSLSFGNQQTAMVYKWGWFQAELEENYPDVEYGVFATPTFSTDTPFAYDRYNGESTPGINKNQNVEQQDVAQDFVRFILANDKYSLVAARLLASFPTKKVLSDNEVIKDDPVLSAIAPRAERLIWPGPMPQTLEENFRKSIEDILYNSVDMDTALSTGQDKIERDMRNSEFQSVEKNYKFYE